MKDAAVSDCATHDIKIICPDGMAGRIGVEEALPVRAESRAIAGKHAPRHLRDCAIRIRSEEHTSELQSLMRISYAVSCLKKKNINHETHEPNIPTHKPQKNNSINTHY